MSWQYQCWKGDASWRRPFVSVCLIALMLSGVEPVIAADPSIDRLLKKLPPPEKVVQRDPTFNDPLAREAIAAYEAKNFRRALSASRKLAQKYPRNLVANALHGIIALSLRQLAEASTAFRATIAIQPKFSFGYLGLGTAEAAQGHFGAGLNYFRQFTRLEPKAAPGWIGCSSCAEMLGRRQESLDFARQATAVAPTSAAAWLQLARAEQSLGHESAMRRALARAQALTPKSTAAAAQKRR